MYHMKKKTPTPPNLIHSGINPVRIVVTPVAPRSILSLARDAVRLGHFLLVLLEDAPAVELLGGRHQALRSLVSSC